MIYGTFPYPGNPPVLRCQHGPCDKPLLEPDSGSDEALCGAQCCSTECRKAHERDCCECAAVAERFA